MITNFWRKKKAECKTSADFRAAIDEAEARLSASQARVADLRMQRQAILLEGEPEAARQNKTEISDAESDIEQCEVQLQALRKSLDETLAAEARAALEREIVACQAEHKEGVDLIQRDYREHAEAIVRILER